MFSVCWIALYGIYHFKTLHLKKVKEKKNNSSNSLHTLLVEKFASTAASQLLICNSGPHVILGIFTEHPCTSSSSLCRNAKGKYKPWYSKHIKSSSSSQVSLLKTKPPPLVVTDFYICQAHPGTQMVWALCPCVLHFTYKSNHTKNQWKYSCLQSYGYTCLQDICILLQLDNKLIAVLDHKWRVSTRLQVIISTSFLGCLQQS